MMTITDAIERIIATRKNLGNRKYFHWSFPRQTGVTTYLGTFAIQLALEPTKPNILFIATNQQAKKDIKIALTAAEKAANVDLSNIDVYTGTDETYRFRGRRYSYIFIDTPTINGESFAALYPLISLSEFTLHIDTTEG